MSKSHPKAIIDALYSGDLKQIEGYVNTDNINLVDEDGHTLLSRVATASDLNMKWAVLKRSARYSRCQRDWGGE
jgi:hypothetical protein